MAETKDLIVRLTLENGKFNAAVKETDNRLKKTEKSTKGLKAGIGKLKAGYLAVAAILTGVVAKGLTSVIKKAADFEQLNVSFTTFLGSADKAKKVLGDLEKFSIVTPFTIDQVNQAGKALLAFGIESDKLTDTLKAVGDVSAATGKDFNELAVIFGKAKTQGTLFAEDINQLTEAGIPIIGEFAKQLGVSESQVKKLGSEGKIRFENLEQAFRDMTGEGGQFFDLMEKQSKTFSGRISTLQGNLSLLARAIGERLLPLLGPIVDKLNKFVSDAEGMRSVKKVVDGVILSFQLLGASFTFVNRLIKNAIIDPIFNGLKAVKGLTAALGFFLTGRLPQANAIAKKSIKDFALSSREDIIDVKDTFTDAFDSIFGSIKDLNEKRKALNENTGTDTDPQIENEKKKADELTKIQQNQLDEFLKIEKTKTELAIIEGERLLSFEALVGDERIAVEKKVQDLRNQIQQEQFNKEMGRMQQRVQTANSFLQFTAQTTQAIEDIVIGSIDRQNLSEEEADQKKKKALHDFAVAKKLLTIFDIGLSTMAAIMRFLVNPGGEAGIVLAAGAGISGAAQTAAAIATPIPQFQSGGIISGLNSPMAPGNEDGVIGVQNGESVLNRSATAMLGEDAIKALNEGREINPNVSITINGGNKDQIVDTLNDYFRSFGGARELGIG